MIFFFFFFNVCFYEQDLKLKIAYFVICFYHLGMQILAQYM